MRWLERCLLVFPLVMAAAATTVSADEVPPPADPPVPKRVVLRGHGRMRLGAEQRPVGEGSILYVPRGAVHAFHNDSPEPAVAYAVYVPAFDGRDRVDVP